MPGFEAAVREALVAQVEGHSAVMAKGPTTEDGWIHWVCRCGEFAWPCPHTLRERIDRVHMAVRALDAD